MRADRQYVISVAGLDPSGGAGLLADVKTFEQLDMMGLGVCTAITLQTEDEFRGVSWVPLHHIELQLDILLQKYPVEYLKIGLIQNLETLDAVIQMIKTKYAGIKIIWDPILKSSSGFQFHDALDEALLHEVLSGICLVTPNAEEAVQLMHEEDILDAAKAMSRFCRVLLKSYSDEHGIHKDLLLENGKETALATQWIQDASKHGSGCVLSAAITAYLAKGKPLEQACTSGKEYCRCFLQSNEGLLGTHKNILIESAHA